MVSSTETLLRRVAPENAELRKLLVALAGELDGLAAEYPNLSERFLAPSQRLRRRLWEVGS